MNNSKQTIRKYYKQICNVLPVSPQKDEALKSLKKELTEYAFQNPNLKYEDLVEKYGQPFDIATMLYPDDTEKSTFDKLIYPKRIIAIILLIVFLTVSICIMAALINGKYASENYSEKDYTLESLNGGYLNETLI